MLHLLEDFMARTLSSTKRENAGICSGVGLVSVLGTVTDPRRSPSITPGNSRKASIHAACITAYR